MNGTRFFHYRNGSSFMHRMNPTFKLILLFVLALCSFLIPEIPALILWLSLIFLSPILFRLKPSEIATDLTPSIFYGSMLMLLTVIQNLISLTENYSGDGSFSSAPFKVIFFVVKPSSEYVRIFAHLSLSIEVSSILYRTTSISAFTEGFRSIEGFFTKGKNNGFSDRLSLTLTFIPRLFDFWVRIDLAWRSRGGKKDLKRIKALTPSLFKESMKEAYVKALALENRM